MPHRKIVGSFFLLILYKSLNTAVISLFAGSTEKAAGNLTHIPVISDALTAFLTFATGISAGTGQFVRAVSHFCPPFCAFQSIFCFEPYFADPFMMNLSVNSSSPGKQLLYVFARAVQAKAGAHQFKHEAVAGRGPNYSRAHKNRV